MNKTDDTQALIEAAEALIQKVQSEQENIDGFYRAENLDPEKVQQTLNDSLTDETRAQAAAEFQADLDAIEQEVAEESARLSFKSPQTSSPLSPDIRMIV